MAENNMLREKNKRLSDAILTLVDHIETKFPSLENHSAKNGNSAESEPKYKPERVKGRGNGSEERKRPKVEIYETYEEPIEFAEPAPQMRFDRGSRFTSSYKKPKETVKTTPKQPEYHVSPDLEPEEIDLLKSPTRERFKAMRRNRETVEVVDLKPKEAPDSGKGFVYEEAAASPSDIPSFEFAEEEPPVDIELQRRETLRAAMRRRVNRLRW